MAISKQEATKVLEAVVNKMDNGQVVSQFCLYYPYFDPFTPQEYGLQLFDSGLTQTSFAFAFDENGKVIPNSLVDVSEIVKGEFE